MQRSVQTHEKAQSQGWRAGWDPGKLAKIYDPDKFYWWHGGSIRKPASQPGCHHW